ncbi:MAG TPA: tRNA (uridine(34)/cytosine(34)/5-carboxymethylaminomethyluridine(34)-2'-O)-methyltransferase TrmL [Gammaproteobacteria bacterium]|nr:tRNA (uridine(34)/cytosine(34)/5-carboxymethylaminomethyluridine(34)-2'-O)-methyltransferase TrmL [Gammaproteobacteria bacterium]
MINIVLFEPEIPPNTGNIIRLAANTGSPLHLIKPFGFELDDKRMRRAGLDYREYAGISVYEGFAEFIEAHANKRLFGISKKGVRRYHEAIFEDDDFLIFGSETRGLPDSLKQQLGNDQILRIPMQAHSRSLNLSNAAAVVVYEAWRQLGFVTSNQ